MRAARTRVHVIDLIQKIERGKSRARLEECKKSSSASMKSAEALLPGLSLSALLYAVRYSRFPN